MVGRLLYVAAALVCCACLGACGARSAVMKAQGDFEQAKAAGAEQKAPYSYHAAEAYLKIAEHESEEMDGDAAEEFAEKSSSFSARALQESGGGAR